MRWIRNLMPKRAVYLYHKRPWAPQIFEGMHKSYGEAAAKTGIGFREKGALSYFLQGTQVEGSPPSREEVALYKQINTLIARGKTIFVGDIGGAAGSAYFNIRPYLHDDSKVQWTIYEVPEAMPQISDFLRTHNEKRCIVRSIDEFFTPEGVRGENVHFLHINDALQYIPDPTAFLRKYAKYFEYCFIGKMHTSPNIKTFVTVQKNASSPCTFVNLGDLSAALQEACHKIFKIMDDPRHFNMKNFPPEYRLDHRRHLFSSRS